MAKKKTSKRAIPGNHDVGYGRPPKSGQIKPGEVRNRWGKTGKPKPGEDLLLKVACEMVPANVNGKSSIMSQEEGAYRRLFQKALEGDPAALKLLVEHLSRRRPPSPPVPTADEIAQREAEEEQKKALAARLVGLLEREASEKKRLAPRQRFGADHRPIAEEPA